MDILALGCWSAMLFRYWATQKLFLLLHPNYMWLSNSAAIALAAMASYKLIKLVGHKSNQIRATDEGHITLLPPGFSSAVLLAVAVFGLIYTPKAFASQTAAQRGISESLTLTRAQPQQFSRGKSAENRTIIDWIRLMNVYPEPDKYTDQPVNVTGFVIHPETWPEDYVMVSRFVLTCCAADAYPVGIPVKLSLETLSGQTKAEAYPVDSWIEVSGKVVTETLDGRRQIAIAPESINAIEAPKNPYEY